MFPAKLIFWQLVIVLTESNEAYCIFISSIEISTCSSYPVIAISVSLLVI